MTRHQAHSNYRHILAEAKKKDCLHNTLREMTKRDPFFRLLYVLNIVPREILDNDWVYDRVREVQREPWGYCDLWAREHFKSTIITQNGIIGDILNEPDSTSCLFSFTRPNAKKLMRPVLHELENNIMLKELYPEILYQEPTKQSPKWSQDEGITVRRRYNPKEPTVMASGLVDGQPTGMHFGKRRYDDVETLETVRTPESMENCENALKMSYNLGVTGVGVASLVGTVYAFNDIHLRAIKDGTFKARIYPATKNGQLDGEPWLWTREQLAQKIREQGPYISSCQLFLNPVADGSQALLESWLRYWNPQSWQTMNVYILVDPASEKKKTSDYTVFTVIGLGYDHNYYIIKQIRDRLNLKQRANVLFKLHQDYRPITVGYEKYGMQADIEYMQEQMELRGYRFSIVPLGGTMPKNDRIKRLVPAWSEGRVYIPHTQPYTMYDGKTVDLTQVFVNDEYLTFPFGEHDDMLDSLARIEDADLCATWPQGEPTDPFEIESQEQRDEVVDWLWAGLR